jgi:hypothetical protein
MRNMGWAWRGAVVAGALLLCAPDLAWAQKRAPKPGAAAGGAKAGKAAGPKGGAAKTTAKTAGAAAGATTAGAAGGASQEPKARVERTAGGGKVIKLTPILVEGKVQKPLALVLARSAIQYEWEKLKQDFTPKIVEAVSKSPF